MSETLLKTRMAYAVMVVSVSALATIGILTSARLIEQKFMPVLVDWKVSSVSVEGEDLVLRGTQRKVRDCHYIAPIRAETVDGEHLLVVTVAPVVGQSWIASDRPRDFGKWVVSGAKGRTVYLYAEHACHPLWRVFSPLGTVSINLGGGYDVR